MKTSCAVAIAALVAIAGFAAAPAVAQQHMVVSATSRIGGPGGDTSQIPRTSIDKYAQVLALDDTQKEMAQTLYEGYADAYQAATKDRRDQMGALMRSMEETGDRTVFQEKMPQVMKAYRDRTTSLEKSFLADLKTLLNDEQGTRWVAVERMRRREVGLARFGGVSGEAVDLVDVTRSLNLSGEGLPETLAQYEGELDRAIQDRLDANEKFADVSPAGDGRLDIDSLQEMMARSREMGQRIRDINQSYARRVENQLSEPDRPPFVAEVRRRSFPQVYREPMTLKMYKAAQGFSDLTPDQKEQVAADLQRYQRELDAANSAWADAIAASEKDASGGAVTMGTGAVLNLRMGDEPQALADARKARRELDEKFRDRLTDRLSKEQKERLPKPEEEQRHMVEGGAQFITIDGGR